MISFRVSSLLRTLGASGIGASVPLFVFQPETAAIVLTCSIAAYLLALAAFIIFEDRP